MLILNGLAYEPGAPEITLLNRGFRLGDGLFMSCRVWGGKLLLVEEQLERLVEGMQLLHFSFEVPAWKALLRREMARALSLNALTAHGRLRVYVYRAGTGDYAPLDDRPLYLIEADSFKSDPYEQPSPLRLCLFRDHSLQHGPLSVHEGTQPLPRILAARHARAAGFDEGLLLCEGYVAESSHYQLFMVKDRKLFTPPLRSGCHNGLMRQQVFRMCQELRIPCQEKKLKPTHLRQADELFVCNILRGLLPVASLDDQAFAPEAYVLHPFLVNSWLRYVKQLMR